MEPDTGFLYFRRFVFGPSDETPEAQWVVKTWREDPEQPDGKGGARRFWVFHFRLLIFGSPPHPTSEEYNPDEDEDFFGEGDEEDTIEEEERLARATRESYLSELKELQDVRGEEQRTENQEER